MIGGCGGGGHARDLGPGAGSASDSKAANPVPAATAFAVIGSRLKRETTGFMG
jgi:hypothetical protein